MTPEEAAGTPAISLCMIVRDEEDRLAACLRAARDAVDEIIVVDTGSLDATPQVARSSGARVTNHAWRDDFAAARNASLAAAQGRFCLYLDADEILRPGGAGRIRELVRIPDLGGGYLKVVSDHGSYRSESAQLRLFRRLPGVRFEGMIHEQIAPSLRSACRPRGLRLLSSDIVLDHGGYHPERLAAGDKLAERLRVLRLHASRNPQDIYLRFKLAELLHEIGDRAGALEEAEAVARLVRARRATTDDLPCIEEISPLVGLCLYEAGRDHEAYRLLRAEVDVTPSANHCFVFGMVAHRLGDHDQAMRAFLRCLALAGESPLNPRREGITSFLARTGLGLVAASRGALPEARRWLEAALDEDSTCDAALRALVELTPAEDRELATSVADRVERYARHAANAAVIRRASGWLVTLGFAQRARSLGRCPSPDQPAAPHPAPHEVTNPEVITPPETTVSPDRAGLRGT